MKKYKVDYTFYNGTEWSRFCGESIIEAENAEEAKKQVEAKSCPWGDYSVDAVAELEGEND